MKMLQVCTDRREGHLLYVGSPTASPINHGNVFSLSSVLFPVYTQHCNCCRNFACGSISLKFHEASIFHAGPRITAGDSTQLEPDAAPQMQSCT